VNETGANIILARFGMLQEGTPTVEVGLNINKDYELLIYRTYCGASAENK